MSRPAFRGRRRRLVIALDIGTTYSGVSYAVLDPGQVPEIKPVTRFPAHELISGASKIPSVIYYDQAGSVKAVGAEAMRDGMFELAEDQGWVKAEWFKLHLRSNVHAQSSRDIASDIPPLPPRKTVVQIFADFLRYLKNCAALYIRDTHANGEEVWKSVEKEIDYVLSHPNGWEGAQQDQMRKAAVMAGLIEDTPAGHALVSFVTEGEASLHFSIQNGLPAGAITNGDGVVIVDAGGGTIDISAYARSSNSTSRFEEIAPPQCHFHGSMFVSIHARMFVADLLADSDYFADLEHIIRCFDNTTKLRFRSTDDPQYIKFGSTRDTEPAFNIRFGQLKLKGTDVAGFFDPSVKCVVTAVREQRKLSRKPIKHVVMVGGFAASDWLFERARDVLRPMGFNVVRPENHVNKAVSDGAISFYLDHFVETRVSTLTYGNICHIGFNMANPEHRRRESTTFLALSGQQRIPDAFDVILPRNTPVSETVEFRRPYFRESANRGDFQMATFTVWGYRGSHPQPQWKDIDPDNFEPLCVIEVDLSRLTLQPRPNGRGGTYFRCHYDIVLLFGSTEFKAQIAWLDDQRVERRGPVRILYNHL